jgi:hypothetical protein
MIHQRFCDLPYQILHFTPPFFCHSIQMLSKAVQSTQYATIVDSKMGASSNIQGTEADEIFNSAK